MQCNDSDSDSSGNSKKKASTKSKSRYKKLQCNDSDSDSSCDTSLSSLRSSVAIQKQVDARLIELEYLAEDSGMSSCTKFKSKRRGGGGPVDVLIKRKVSWSHEAIWGGVNRTRVTCDQLSISQWVQGFCRYIIDEKDEGRHMQKLSYMSDLMEDATDFSWQGVKAAHAVLL